jgi:hypothetical protein
MMMTPLFLVDDMVPLLLAVAKFADLVDVNFEGSRPDDKIQSL